MIASRIVAATFLLPLMLSTVAPASEVKITFAVKVPDNTPTDARLYLAGDAKNLGEWNPAGVELARGEDGLFTAIVSLERETQVQYKVTRGAWETVEKNADGSEMNNRSLVPTREARVDIEVMKWGVAASTKPASQRATAATTQASTAPTTSASTRTGDIRVHPKVHSKELNNDRDILVWLPPGYDKDTDRRYPVLYMHDGQNVFDAATSFAGEWRADETAEKLIAEGKIEPLIIVGIANTKDRMSEYTPIGFRDVAPKGDAYARFVVQEVKPFIERTYRTLPGRENAAVGGSSLGGLISLYIAGTYPDQFAKAAVLSPAVSWDGKRLYPDNLKLTQAKVWLDSGTAEGESLVPDVRTLSKLLENQGLQPDKGYVLKIFEGAQHNEPAWADRFDQVLQFLFPPETKSKAD